MILLLGFFVRLWIARGPRNLYFPPETKVEIVKGDTLAKFYINLSQAEIFRCKRYLKTHSEISTSLQEGTYILSGTYTAAEFLEHIAKWPTKEFISYTVLEWRSIYDIDDNLAKKGYIQPWAFIAYTTNPDKIAELSQRYDFFDASITSLEGFLYPDTYYLDNRNDLVNQLVSIQLNTFKRRVWEEYSSDFAAIQNKYGLSVYETVNLASIIEKEEKNADNKSTVAGIFYNRIQRGMLLGADITLCYHFKQPYVTCTPSVIAKNVSDAKNPYNTRQVAGLPPTPIGNPNVVALQAVLFPQQTSYLFYLHDSKGGIHYAETNAAHERNKAQWL